MARMRAAKNGGVGTRTEGRREARLLAGESGREVGSRPCLTYVCLQRARTDEVPAGGSRSEAEDEDDEDYVPYVPLRQRRQLLVRGPRPGRDGAVTAGRREGSLRSELQYTGARPPDKRGTDGLI